MGRLLPFAEIKNERPLFRLNSLTAIALSAAGTVPTMLNAALCDVERGEAHDGEGGAMSR